MQHWHNNYILLFQEETTYGEELATPDYDYAVPDTGVIKEMTSAIDYMQKTGTLEPKENSKLNGNKSGTITVSGALSADDLHKVLFISAFNHDTVYKFSAIDTPKSYTIYRYHIGQALSDICLGAVLETIKITGNFNGLVTYDATYRLREVKRDQTTASTYWGAGNVPVIPLVNPLKMNDVVFTNPDDETDNIISFEVTLTNKFNDDESTYTNSDLKQAEGLCSPSTGQMTFAKIYDTLTGYYYVNLLESLKTFNIRLREGSTAGNKYIDLDLQAKITEYEQPDGECVFKETISTELRGTASDDASYVKYGAI